jgi:quercetin dioxygenase-like cupin family protein
MRLSRAIAGGVLAALAIGAPAGATPPDPGVTATTIWQRRVAGTELTMREIHIPPGAGTGWHYHDGRLYARVKQGTLWHYDESCLPDGVYRTGRFLTERGGRDNVHIGRNLGRTELVLEVLYVLPAGSPFAEDAANPGCPFG